MKSKRLYGLCNGVYQWHIYIEIIFAIGQFTNSVAAYSTGTFFRLPGGFNNDINNTNRGISIYKYIFIIILYICIVN